MIMRSISGIRGRLPEFNSETVTRYAQAFHALLPTGVLILGRDTRPSGEDFIEDAARALLEVGRDIINLNIVPTPTVQFMVETTDAAGGMIITASHNPDEWNGLKFVHSDGTFLYSDQCTQLFTRVDQQHLVKSDSDGLIYPDVNALLKHVLRVVSLSCVQKNQVRERQFKVVVDAGNGAAFEALPLLLETLGCTVIKIHCTNTGKFARKPEPLPEHLGDLRAAVIEHKADVGFATDPDGDRLAVVLDDGRPAGDEYTLVLAADGYLRMVKDAQTIVTNISSTIALDKLAEKYNATIERTAVGEINVVQKMLEDNAALGGEGNGGVILKEAHLGRDSLVAAAMILQRLSMTQRSIGAVYDDLPQYKIIKDQVELQTVNKEEVFGKVKLLFNDAKMDNRDGLKLTWDNCWVHLRSSNTEPIMRIYAEARTEAEAQKLVEKVKSIL